MAQMIEINGAAYLDSLVRASNRTPKQLAKALHCSETRIYTIRRDNRIPYALADQIQLMFGVPVNPYIQVKKAEQPDPPREVETDGPTRVTMNDLIAVMGEGFEDFVRAMFKKAMEQKREETGNEV